MATVIFNDHSYGEVTEEQLELLLQKQLIVGYQRSGLWIAANTKQRSLVFHPAQKLALDWIQG